MTVEDLIEELKAMSQTAIVFIESYKSDADEYEYEPIIEIVYDLARVSIRF